MIAKMAGGAWKSRKRGAISKINIKLSSNNKMHKCRGPQARKIDTIIVIVDL